MLLGRDPTQVQRRPWALAATQPQVQRRWVVATAVAITVLLAAAWHPHLARADGDPASDVLASQTLFLPQDAGIPHGDQERLASLLNSAQRSGYRVRVALIATPSDLGSISELWRRPGSYARFLGQELSLVYRGSLLVVMPNGFGVYHQGPPAAGAVRLPAPGSPARLAAAALSAVQSLAAAAGHRLAAPTASPAPPGGSGDSVDLGAWAAFGIGLA